MKTTPTEKSIHSCPCCENGRMLLHELNFQTGLQGESVTIPNIEMERCDNCSESFLTPTGSRQVDDWHDEKSETVSPENL